MEHLRARVALGLFPDAVLSLPPEQALDGLASLWKELRDAELRRDRLILMGWLALAVVQTTACTSCFGGGDLGTRLWAFVVCTGFASPIPLFMLCRRRTSLQSCREAIRNTADQASGQDCVAPLLDLLEAPGLSSVHFRLTAALARLLPWVTTTEARALTESQRQTLCRAIQRHGENQELLIAGLLVLGGAQDASLVELARALVTSSREERVREAAREYLAALGVS
jgi:hypothetical protein